MSYTKKTGMKFKTAELNLRADSNAPDVSLDEANDLNLYDDLLAFTDLSPEEQKAAMNRISASALLDSSQQSPVETAAVYEQQQAFAPVKEKDCEPQQTNAFNKDSSADFQLAEILRVTGQLADFSALRDSSSICGDCGSPASSEDLFCITCGGPLGEVELVASLSCGDCGETIVSDEIFCPSCGSAMFGA
jgi:double zinc ribbon protein